MGRMGEGAWEDQARMDPCMNLRAFRGRQSEKSRLRVFETVCVCRGLGGGCPVCSREYVTQSKALWFMLYFSTDFSLSLSTLSTTHTQSARDAQYV